MTVRQRSVLEELTGPMAAAGAAAAMTLVERPHMTQLDVRATAPLAEDAAIALPVTPNTWSGDEPKVLWLGPDEWLVVSDSDSPEALEQGLRGADPVGSVAAVVDVTDQRTVLELRGERARDILAQGCALDLHPRAFAPGQCAQTTLAQVAVIVAQLDDTPAYWLFVRRSFAEHLVHWLLDAMADLAGP